MTKKVYKHLLEAYGKNFYIYVSFVSQFINSVSIRIVGTFILATSVADLADGDIDSAKQKIVIYAAISVVAAIFRAISGLSGHRAENKVYNKHSRQFYDKLTSKDLSYFRDNHAGYLAALYRQYTDGSLLLIRYLRTDILNALVSITFPVIVLFFLSWQIGAIALMAMILQVLYIHWTSEIVQKYRIRSHEIYRTITGLVADVVTNIIAYKSSGHEKQSRDAYINYLNQETATFWQRRKTAIVLDFPRQVITFLLVSLAIWIAIDQAQSSNFGIALLVATIIYIFQIIRNVSDVPDILDRHEDLVTKIYPTLEIFDDKHESVNDPANPKELTISKASIEFRDVSFSYELSGDIFKNFNLTIKGGEKIGIVGLSGAGKSTLAGLLMRFDDVNKGKILIDGVDIREVKQNDLRSSIAYVPQEPLLFHKTIRENIDYMNRDGASEKKMLKAAKASHAHEFVKGLPNGYDTLVGERGVKLSGGQKQRIAIARAIMKEAPIMLFDEATSALDSESEQIIQSALPEIIGSHTSIIIAHRLSTLSGMDRIIVMHDGKIEEEGTHKELLKLNGRYARLWDRQTNN